MFQSSEETRNLLLTLAPRDTYYQARRPEGTLEKIRKIIVEDYCITTKISRLDY